MAAVVAMLDPEAAANSPQAPTLAEAKPPGTRASSIFNRSKAPVVSPVFAAMNPISRNIGIAVRDQSPIKLNGSALTMPNAAVVFSMAEIPTKETIIRAMPMDMRRARSANRPPTPIQPMVNMLMLRNPFHVFS